jgi:hypothetical protein
MALPMSRDTLYPLSCYQDISVSRSTACMCRGDRMIRYTWSSWYILIMIPKNTDDMGICMPFLRKAPHKRKRVFASRSRRKKSGIPGHYVTLFMLCLHNLAFIRLNSFDLTPPSRNPSIEVAVSFPPSIPTEVKVWLNTVGKSRWERPCGRVEMECMRSGGQRSCGSAGRA